MSDSLLDIIKRSFGENSLFGLDEIVVPKSFSGSVSKEMAKLVEDGAVGKYAYGLYFLQSKKPNLSPSFADAVQISYISNSQNVYGFYGDESYLDFLLKKKPSNNVVVYSNKATSGKKKIFRFGQRITVKKPYCKITKENATLNGFLSYLTFASMNDIERGYSLLADYIREEHFAAQDVLDLLASFPSKTANKLLRSGLYKCLWKH